MRKFYRRYIPKPIREVIYSIVTMIRQMQYENWLLGKFVELRGNRVVVDGCIIHLDSPEIDTKLKVRFLTNRYEREERHFVNEYLANTTLPVIEFGASIGVISCITNKSLNNPEKHIVVEANPRLLSILQKNKEANRCKFEICHLALGYEDDEITFYLHDKFVGGSVQRATNNAVRVPSTSLQQIIETNHFNACHVICDIEGGEIELVEHEIAILQAHTHLFIVSTHDFITGDESVQTLVKTLQDHGFVIKEQIGGDYVFANTRTMPA